MLADFSTVVCVACPPSQVFEKVTAKLESTPGLRDRVQLFLMSDPTPLTPDEVRCFARVARDSCAVGLGRHLGTCCSSCLLVVGASSAGAQRWRVSLPDQRFVFASLVACVSHRAKLAPRVSTRPRFVHASWVMRPSPV